MTLIRGKFGWVVGFFIIALLVVGGLGWVTREALQMEEERHLASAERERDKLQKEQDKSRQEELQRIADDRAAKMRQALMLLDIRIGPALAREDSRPYPHFEALYSPFPAVTALGVACEPGQVLIPSPLMTAELPPWMLLHFQVDPIKGWTSPQVVPDALQKTLRKQPLELALNNCDESHKKHLDELRTDYPVRKFFTCAQTNRITFENLNLEQQAAQQDLNAQITNSLNYTNPNGNTYTGNTAQPQPQLQNGINFGQNGGQLFNGYGNLSQNNDNGDNNKRYQITSRGKTEGLWSYLGDGRGYSSRQSAFTYQSLERKQAEVAALEKQMNDGDNEVKKSLQSKLDTLKKDADELRRALQPDEIELTPMRPLWLPKPDEPKHLLIVRAVRISHLGTQPAYQGILLDWPILQDILKSEIGDLFPEARLIPLAKNDPEHLDRQMTSLPIELDPGPMPEPEAAATVEAPPVQRAGWTPLRIGLAIAWVAALIALAAVGLGGWSLLDLSERRIRFVSAVTHELRTPLTTLRLYLDLLSSGMVSEEKQKEEYLKTLTGEADRLHRLIGNVLDFARLEKTHPTIDKKPVAVADLLEQLRGTWHECCASSNKDLQVANTLPEEATAVTDRKLVEQILGNLIDNARKYSQDAADPRILLRARQEGDRLFVEVEDRGPGVTTRERGSIFRPFRRGHDADFKAGGVGLGLALATRWAGFIGGKLSVQSGENGVGACFRLELNA